MKTYDWMLRVGVFDFSFLLAVLLAAINIFVVLFTDFLVTNGHQDKDRTVRTSEKMLEHGSL